MDDEEKLEEIKRAFIEKIMVIETLKDMISLIKNISPQRVKDFIKSGFQGDIDNSENTIVNSENAIIVKQNLINEIDNI